MVVDVFVPTLKEFEVASVSPLAVAWIVSPVPAEVQVRCR